MIKSIQYYKNSKIFKEGVSVSIQTFNSEKRIKRLLDAIKKENHSEIIICDHNSQDNTVEIAKNYTDKILILDKDLGRERALLTAKLREFKYLFSIETDQYFEYGIIDRLKNELIESENLLVSGILKVQNPKTIYEKFLHQYYILNNEQRFPGTPFLAYNEFYKDLLDNFEEIVNGAGYDTSIIDIFLKKKLAYKITDINCFQEEKLDMKVLVKKFFWYGNGDYNFYQMNKNRMTLFEKIKSLTHVFKKYFIIFPIKSILRFKFIFIFFIFYFGVIRYLGFFSKILKKKI